MFLTKAVFLKILKGLRKIHAGTSHLNLVLCFQATSIPLYFNDILCYNHSLIRRWFAGLLGFQALQPTSASSSHQNWELPPAPAARLPAHNIRLIRFAQAPIPCISKTPQFEVPATPVPQTRKCPTFSQLLVPMRKKVLKLKKRMHQTWRPGHQYLEAPLDHNLHRGGGREKPSRFSASWRIWIDLTSESHVPLVKTLCKATLESPTGHCTMRMLQSVFQVAHSLAHHASWCRLKSKLSKRLKVSCFCPWAGSVFRLYPRWKTRAASLDNHNNGFSPELERKALARFLWSKEYAACLVTPNPSRYWSN